MRLPYNQAADFYRERDFGQKISATLEFIAGHWRPLGQVLAYIMLPAILVRSVAQALLLRYLPVAFAGQSTGQPLDAGGALVLQAGMWKTLFVSQAYWVGSLVGAVSFSLLLLSVYGYVVLLARRRAPGPPVAVADVWALARREFLGTFFSLWGVGLLIGAGFLVLFVPGFYLLIMLSLFFIVKLSEGIGFGATLSRCWRLTRGKWWSTFGLIAVALLLYYIVLAGIGGAAVMAWGGFSATLEAARTRSPLVGIVVTCLGSLFTLLLYPPLLLALAFQYFNLVERHDGTGLRLLVDRLGQGPASQVSNAAYRPDDEGEY